MDGIRFEGFGTPEQVRQAQIESARALEQARKERIERVKQIKNKKARQAGQRADRVLAELGLSKRDRQNIGKRERKPNIKRTQNYRWDLSRADESTQADTPVRPDHYVSLSRAEG